MRWHATLLLICAYLSQILSAQTIPDAKLPIDQRAFVASKIYSMLQLYFSGWKAVPDLDLDIAYRNYLEKALIADDHRQFDLATLEFVARLRNGHTLFSDSWLRQNYGQGLGFYARPLDGKWVVIESAVAGIKQGDVLLKINDTETETFFRQQQKYISASSEAAQRHNDLPPIFVQVRIRQLCSGPLPFSDANVIRGLGQCKSSFPLLTRFSRTPEARSRDSGVRAPSM